jgi:hypothetical protein
MDFDFRDMLDVIEGRPQSRPAIAQPNRAIGFGPLMALMVDALNQPQPTEQPTPSPPMATPQANAIRGGYRDDVMDQLAYGGEQRAANGYQMPAPQVDIQRAPPELYGIFGGGYTPQPPPARPSAPSPGLGSGVPNTGMFEDGSIMVPGAHNDPLLGSMSDVLNRRFPNEGIAQDPQYMAGWKLADDYLRRRGL